MAPYIPWAALTPVGIIAGMFVVAGFAMEKVTRAGQNGKVFIILENIVKGAGKYSRWLTVTL